jgi:hypothetical protein
MKKDKAKTPPQGSWPSGNFIIAGEGRRMRVSKEGKVDVQLNFNFRSSINHFYL